MITSYAPASELLLQGYTVCYDGDLNMKVFDMYDTTHIALMDKEGNPHLFVRHGNDYLSHVHAIINNNLEVTAHGV
ncbi:hypothetical protein P8918_13825 [Bacillus spizizenii]|nr:hypothetical protein [Bacillus spizizenii]MCY8890382.1 hypothetical protein [Bacillus spizizenii]MEC0842108.1 hypothetical protein [Bacillus spizizenii]